MKTLVMKPSTAAKLGICAVALAVAALGLGQDRQPAAAAEPTRIFMTPADFSPIEILAGIILFPDGPGIELTFWAQNVVSTYGAGSFQLDVGFESTLLHVNSVAEGDPDDGMTVADDWLSAGQTQVVLCSAPFIRNYEQTTGQGQALVGCSILGAPSSPPAPPWGAGGDGVLGTIYVTPGSTKALTSLTMGSTWIADTGELLDTTGDTIPDTVIEPAFIPAKAVSLPVIITACADWSGLTGVPDGWVTIIDIFYEAGNFGSNYTFPDWNPDWDMNLDDYVTIPDILTVARQFGTVCP